VPVAISVVEGKPAVEIPDAHGEVFLYLIEALPPDHAGWRCWAVTRREPDEDAGHAYVVRSDGRRWGCNCPAFAFNRLRWQTGCKHSSAVKELAAFQQALAVCVPAPVVAGSQARPKA
jgi:hypothetical protein